MELIDLTLDSDDETPSALNITHLNVTRRKRLKRPPQRKRKRVQASLPNPDDVTIISSDDEVYLPYKIVYPDDLDAEGEPATSSSKPHNAPRKYVPNRDYASWQFDSVASPSAVKLASRPSELSFKLASVLGVDSARPPASTSAPSKRGSLYEDLNRQKSREMEKIESDSDSDCKIVDSPLKRLRETEKCYFSDSASDPECAHDGLDLHRESNWTNAAEIRTAKPSAAGKQRPVVAPQSTWSTSLHGKGIQRATYPRVDLSLETEALFTQTGSVLAAICNDVPAHELHRTQSSSRLTGLSRGRRMTRRDLLERFGLYGQRHERCFRSTSGGIHAIAQTPGYVVIGSAAAHGIASANEQHDTVGPDNHSGNLVAWHDGNQCILHAHTLPRQQVLPVRSAGTSVDSELYPFSSIARSVGPNRKKRRRRHKTTLDKFFTVSDIAFDPVEKGDPKFLTAGGDGVVYVWQREYKKGTADDDEQEIASPEQESDNGGPDDSDQSDASDTEAAQYGAGCEFTAQTERLYPWRNRDFARPHFLRFRCMSEDDLGLAISCTDGNIYFYENYLEGLVNQSHHHRLDVDAVAGHAVGEVLWGSNNWLYASSESATTGRHRAFNLNRRHQSAESASYFADIGTASGDAMAISPDQRTLAVLSLADGLNTLRLYDVASGDRSSLSKATATRDLAPFSLKPRRTLEVAEAAFSPDGRFLACGRNDDMVHVYDVRNLARRPLAVFAHDRARDVNAGTGMDHFGVTQLKWVEGRSGGRQSGLGLVSGGGDGRVLLWDMRRTDMIPETLAQMDYGISAFSIGDPTVGERRLVVGDCSGFVSAYDTGSRSDDLW